MSLTAEQIERARELRMNGERYMPWSVVARKMGLQRETVRRAVDPEYLKQRVDERATVEARRTLDLRDRLQPVVVPADRAEERERAVMAPRTLTAEILGDPLPGRSALDKMRLASRPAETARA